MTQESLFGQVFGEPMPEVPMPPPITAWSYSRLRTYEECPRRAKYQFVDKLPEPESEAIVRGKNVHSVAAAILAEQDPPASTRMEDIEVLMPWRRQLDALKAMGAKPELQAAFTIDWEPTEWFSRRAWLRVVFDAIVYPSTGTRVLTIDFKTGKPHDTHHDQLSLYGCASHAMYGDMSEFEVCFVYLDYPQRRPLVRTFTATELVAERTRWEERAGPMLRETEFPTRVGPGCRWCPYAASKGGPCEQG